MKAESRVLLATALVTGLAVGWVTGCASSGLRAQATLGPAGGTLSIPSEGVTLEVPPGALGSTTEVTLSARSDGTEVLVGIEPAQLALAKSAMLGVTLSRPVHFFSVTEVTAEGERPLGLQSRVETTTGASARLALDRFIQVRLSTDGPSDGGAPGACRRHDDGDGDHHHGDQGDGEHDDGDGDHHGDDGGVRPDGGCDGHPGEDAGVHRDDGSEHGEDAGFHPDGGTVTTACPPGFECDDGVCVADGGDDEERDRCGGADAGSCPTGLHCEEGHCVAPRDGGHED
jgi:hypothetical protein